MIQAAALARLHTRNSPSTEPRSNLHGRICCCSLDRWRRVTYTVRTSTENGSEQKVLG